MDGTKDQLDQLKLIDDLQRLDISKHFDDQIRIILDNIFPQTIKHCRDEHLEKDLYATALQFRLLRQHGYHVPQEVFYSFMDDVGNCKMCLCGDLKGILCLYEASFLSVEGETILDLAKDFLAYHLRELIRLEQITDMALAELVKHALELPLHWRVKKLEAKWFINFYESGPDANPILLELAKLDFNMVQAQYQDDIKHMSKWYEDTGGLQKKLSFARYRLAECFLLAIGFALEPHLGDARKILTKGAIFVTIIDDIYDVYGTLKELQVFTETIERWDINELDRLPEYMRICFLALFNFANELAYDILRDQGVNIIPNLKNLYHDGYFPSINEYLNTAWISSSGPVALFHTYFITTNPINKKELQYLEQYPGIIRWTSMVLRLVNDLGTTTDEMKKGDVPKSIQCYMEETDCSGEDAHGYIRNLIDMALKRMDKDILKENPVRGFGATVMNVARIILCIYQHGDGFGSPHSETKKNMVSLIVNLISMS
ncbi:Exo-alpha-bergamotene synthase [Handroanthus impetiginosus]|uniref:Exo-alpha-bergamotene synthase n=1 Tax=Handroanthus impetiginosus TaxID=429701 RepID=A0A2G9HAC3_9LAMI|nr:Exo-alpha-bergamotene synthase [Handroanthus impetiginosus]